MRPSVHDIQTALTKGTQLVLEVSRAVIQWDEDRDLMAPLGEGGACSQTLSLMHTRQVTRATHHI